MAIWRHADSTCTDLYFVLIGHGSSALARSASGRVRALGDFQTEENTFLHFRIPRPRRSCRVKTAVIFCATRAQQPQLSSESISQPFANRIRSAHPALVNQLRNTPWRMSQLRACRFPAEFSILP